MTTLYERVRAALAGFREGFLSAALPQPGEFAAVDARLLRYQIYWSFYENTAYRNMHTWASGLKTAHGLYRHIRGIYNPSYRLGEFWKSHLWGGSLDPEAGPTGALPILTENNRLRPALAALWRESGWAVQKDVAGLWGPILGDLFIKVIDDPLRGKVYLDLVHPAKLRTVTYDRYGNIKGYEIVEEREHPEQPGRTVTYTERASRVPGEPTIYYETLLDDVRYGWDGGEGAWSEPYGFVPMVAIQHNNVGLDWGWSELHAGRAKFQEVDDIASKLSDYIRRVVVSPMLVTGVQLAEEQEGKVTIEYTAEETAGNPEALREEQPILYADIGADAKPLIVPLEIAQSAGVIGDLLRELERDYPELQMDIWTAAGDVSGRALRAARARVEDKVNQRRPAYDNALVRAQQMALAIGGWRGYPPYRGFNLDSYARGDLDHTIGPRPVFAPDPLDEAEIEQAFWQTAGLAVAAGVDLAGYLRSKGWDDTLIRMLTDAGYSLPPDQ